MQIDHTNYEAFYLDYLEGNLSGAELEAFEAFIAVHPELALEDTELPQLLPTDETFDPVQKLALRQPIDLAALNASTIEFFLIAREEGLLDSSQQAQLNHWLEANAHYQQDARLYAMVKLESDLTETYAHKSELKRPLGRVIPLWWPGVAAAAGIALLVTIGLGYNTGTNPTQSAGTHSRKGENTHAYHNPVHTTPVQVAGTQNGKKRNTPQKTPAKQTNQSPSKVKRFNYQRNILLEDAVLASLEKRQATLQVETPSYVTPLPEDVAFVRTEPVTAPEKPQTDLAWTPVSEMKNPIEPVTNTLSSTFNTPVDFRTAKASKRKSGGFYLKIGKLEVSNQSASLW